MPAKEVIYLERNMGESLSTTANHFSLRFNPLLKRVEVVVFDSDDKSIHEYQYDPVYTCENGILMRESHVSGGSEGCSKSIHTMTRIFITDDHSLVFESLERAKFGAACFNKNIETRRVTSYKKFR